MRLGLALGYGGEPMEHLLPVVEHAERIGVDSIWSVEEYGPDAVSVLGYLAARTERIELGTAIMQIPARTPAATAMTAMTLDVLSKGRFQLGLGLSVPWIVEGWHGQPYTRPLQRTREYVEIVRKAIAHEERVEHGGEIYRLPYRGPGSTGRARPVRSEMNPLRPHIPIYLGAIGPRNVALTGEIADGWLAGMYAPEHEKALTRPLDEGITGAGRASSDVKICPILYVSRAATPGEGRDRLRPLFAHLIGAVAPGVRNTYFDVACQMGYEGAAHDIRRHFADGHKTGAAQAVPDTLLDEVALVGPLPAIVERILAWKDSRVDTLILLDRDTELMEAARAVL
ncbi:LLM class F420-dependent oxidoreductase [Sphaerisporangium siamense]|uniref:F420-dependent oxidoreductase-like protein n=1 Tax=Sphaerisporangium siamense TaxID=795645 RepID=A0A7W7D4W7_9ACTN|nr:LLM class F420-dependent oxidoreductase [Sphaerisporangium siamense]MBB4699365.1 F420-dependent oxidoreductase-like protein [Sphaerisporangium siamense]GII89275.1 LLM class F420-dependent oxidoreductase [Sphaerisporangium siamense]